MKNEIVYEIPVYSSNLDKDPLILSQDMNMKIELVGVDDENRLRKISIQFNSVICYKYTLSRFTPKLYDSYDKIVELVDSDWLMELKKLNEEDFNYWNPKHYVLYLDGIGLFQFISQNYEVVDHE